jgi:CheY-like chemotaxis protein
VDVVLMDIQMPVMDGITATRLLRERERIGNRRATPVIALTGNNSTDDRRACLDAGMNTFLTKPYTFEQLKTALYEQTANH